MSVEPESESTGNAELDKRLTQPILRGDVGIDTAQVWISAFLICIVGIIGWSSSLRVPFQALDQQLVRDNLPLHSLVTLPNAAIDGAPQPLALFTLALNWAVAPGSPGLMRFTSLLLHLANGLLVFLVCRRLMPKSAPVVAMIAGMLFVLHPLASESILYVIGRGPVLATTLSLASILLFICAVTDETGLGTGALVASVFFFIFAALADSSSAVIPAILLATHWCLADRARAPWRIHAPYWAALLALAVYAAVQHGLPGPGNLPALFAQYARMSFAPYGLSIVHDAPAIHLFIGIAVLALAILITAAMMSRRSVGGLAVLWLVLGLAYAAWHGPAVVERRAYFALTGLALLAPWLYEFVQPGLRPVAGIAAAALVLASGVASYMRTTAWRSEFDLWQDAEIKAPISPAPPAELGRLFAAQAQQSQNIQLAAEAESRLRDAIRRDHSNVEPKLWLAAALQVQGKTDQSLQALFDVLRIDLNNRDAALAAANLLFDTSSNKPGANCTLAEAVDLYRKADAGSPLDAPALARLGAGLSQFGHLEPAEAALKRAAALDPANQTLAQSLKNIGDARKLSAATEQQAVALLKKNPTDPNGLKLVARAQALRGNQLAASYSLDAVWQTGAADFTTWVLTGFVWARLDAMDNFVRGHPVPPAKPADKPFAWAELAKACAESGMWDAAESYLRSQPARDEQPTNPLLILADIAQQLNQPQRAQQYNKSLESGDRSPQ
ncbi:MAG: hypothetical protein NTZ09_05535 [Candidatus Hydrogenedentes bacterium]|nr:hypothetical protein [Candidatus Hydrogenedentota bacterium]